MLIVNAQELSSIDQALKILKSKVFNTHLVKELRERQTYLKPSVKRREEISNAVRKEKILKSK
jgi:small subunit ribosomal protein S21